MSPEELAQILSEDLVKRDDIASTSIAPGSAIILATTQGGTKLSIEVYEA
jgi:hypothetical protein